MKGGTYLVILVYSIRARDIPETKMFFDETLVSMRSREGKEIWLCWVGD